MQFEVRRVTQGPKHHFFAYYDKTPWDVTGRYLLAGAVDFADRNPTANDPLTIGLVDLDEGCRFVPLAESTAWHWQMGCRMQWLGQRGHQLIYNDRRGGRLVSVVREAFGAERRVLPMPVADVSRDGRLGVALDLHRVHHYRTGYGIAESGDYRVTDPSPDDQGLYTIDLRSGDCRLIISVAQVAATDPSPDMAGASHWLNHVLLNPSATRILFLHRYRGPNVETPSGWTTRMFTARPDGGDLFVLNPQPMTSHFDWMDDTHVLAWASWMGTDGYYLFTDKTHQAARIGASTFSTDGHCSFSPNRKWMLTDTYPDPTDSNRTLILYRWPDGPRINLGQFYGPTPPHVETRCDLHPRWHRDGTAVCIDSMHERTRQMYVIDVSQATSI